VRRSIQFSEVQQFRQAWLWYLLVSSSLVSLLPVIVIASTGNEPLWEGLAAIGAILLITGINLSAFYITRLEISMNDEGIAYRWWPFFRRHTTINWKDVEFVSMHKYSAMQFGAHRHKELGRVHNVDGNQGYRVVLHNGKKYYFGTQKRNSVEPVLEQTGKFRR
jgi:hypothetical protein